MTPSSSSTTRRSPPCPRSALSAKIPVGEPASRRETCSSCRDKRCRQRVVWHKKLRDTLGNYNSKRPICRGSAHSRHQSESAFFDLRVQASGKTLKRKAADLVPWLASSYQVGENFADHRRKLEPVARAWRRKNNMRIAGKAVDNEIAIGRDSIKAGRGFDPASVRVGEVICKR